MNIEFLARAVIQPIVPESSIQLYIYGNKSVDAAGKVAVTWAAPIATTAQVQLENKQTLMHIEGLDLTKIYKRFYIQGDTITGLNRNLSTGGDYIEMSGVYYKIIEVPENFKTEWVQVIGCQASALGGN